MRHLALAVFLVAACSPTHTSAPEPSLYLAYHERDVYSYSFKKTTHAMFNGLSDTLSETAHLNYTVRSVDAAGNADLSLDTSTVVITSTIDQFTAPMSSLPNNPIDLMVAADGRILSENVNGNPSGAGITWVVLTGGAVKPGEAWSKDYSMTLVGSVGTNHFTTTSRYLRNESFQGADAAVVETTMTNTSDLFSAASTPGGSTVSGKGTSNAVATTWIDRYAHRILKSHVTATFDQSESIDDPSMPLPTVVSLKGDEIADLLPA